MVTFRTAAVACGGRGPAGAVICTSVDSPAPSGSGTALPLNPEPGRVSSTRTGEIDTTAVASDGATVVRAAGLTGAAPARARLPPSPTATATAAAPTTRVTRATFHRWFTRSAFLERQYS